ncbi:aspartate aminotransferase [Anaerosporobacter mobilis DSM 15930]|jgi:aspartate aminotransferase-like enzyme|uniref:Aspartate aminotransferase n=1 Tax=Anaerosporobacter mobilis DSM 15930 TaxID=1120996 RepID=A0A1M7LPC9_9FIRM|nr:aminotransferase class V-fold PLP-dependent enzyme [Anaerosporobacter mobilis]SHM79882.1 aspartate aminotransferase [Anaerosporobacter mobilis DSM 15930]
MKYSSYNKLNFTVGPVMMDPDIKKIGSNNIPYFRTQEFSELMKENEKCMKLLLRCNENGRVIFLTGSGTSAMEAALMNSFTRNDKVLVVNGGGFGERFVKLCDIHNISYTEIRLRYGESLKTTHLEPYESKGYTGFIINMHETSTGVLYDMPLVSEFCKRNNCFLLVDAISSFLADEIKMEEWGINLLITASQKALALPPGIAIIVMNVDAVDRINKNKVQSLYFDLKEYLINGERGQTPFTPAVGTLIQMNKRLLDLRHKGIEKQICTVRKVAEDFRKKIKLLPFEIPSDSLSNAVTPLRPLGKLGANDIFNRLETEYGIWVCPNGGELKDSLFRVGHIGNISIEDNDKLIQALIDMKNKNIL